jgi:predicted DNA-binding protein with PD1-like motif
MGTDDLAPGSPRAAPGASPVRALALRLRPGDDLRAAIEAVVREQGLAAAAIATCVGSLARAALRLAGAKSTTVLDGPFEIVSLVGTFSPDGAHLHVSLADRDGRVTGGHLLAGSTVHTTAEVVLLSLPELAFARTLDRETGWKELVIRPRA